MIDWLISRCSRWSPMLRWSSRTAVLSTALYEIRSVLACGKTSQYALHFTIYKRRNVILFSQCHKIVVICISQFTKAPTLPLFHFLHEMKIFHQKFQIRCRYTFALIRCRWEFCFKPPYLIKSPSLITLSVNFQNINELSMEN